MGETAARPLVVEIPLPARSTAANPRSRERSDATGAEPLAHGRLSEDTPSERFRQINSTETPPTSRTHVSVRQAPQGLASESSGSGDRGGDAASRWAFRPGEMAAHGLERRTLPSSSSRMHDRPGTVRSSRSNVTYPTPAGPSEQLNVYSPAGPAPPGGRPVIVAIHGGGWRRLDKAGYGDRIASAFVPQGYVVVAPNYMLSAPGRPSWPVNLDDVRSAVAWVRSNAGRAGHRPEPRGRDGRVGRRQPGRACSGPIRGRPVRDLRRLSRCGHRVLDADRPDGALCQSPWAGRAAAQFLGGSPRQVPAQLRRGLADRSCCARRSADVPGARPGGSADSGQPVRGDGRGARRGGVRNQLILVQGGHDLDFPVHYANLTRRILEFLSATWKDEGTPSPSEQPQQVYSR